METSAATSDHSQALTAIEMEAIAFFARNAQQLGFPRSLGELFGLLFASSHPLPFEVFAQKLPLSRGSVSTGLRHLHRLGAVKITHVYGDRRTFYEAEMSLRKVVHTFIEDNIRPALDENDQGIQAIGALLEDETNAQTSATMRRRLDSLSAYQRILYQLLPMLTAVTKTGTIAARILKQHRNEEVISEISTRTSSQLSRA